MKNPFSNETVKSAAIVIGSAAAFIALSKGVSVLRKKFGGNPKVKAIFGSAENADRGSKRLNERQNELASGSWARRSNACETLLKPAKPKLQKQNAAAEQATKM